MRLRFRPARAVSSTRYAILCAYFVEHFTCRTGATVRYVFQTLPDAFGGTGVCRQVEQVLVGFGVLYDRGSLPVHRQDNGTLGLPEVLHYFRRMVAERGHRLNVFGDVHERCATSSCYLIR